MPLLLQNELASGEKHEKEAYWITNEGITFSKMKSLCQLEERHGVDLGECYKNDHASATFVDFIAEDHIQLLSEIL